MTVAPYVFFNGTCREALSFYAGIFGTEPMIMGADGMPDDFPVSEEQKTWVMHGQLKIGEGMLMASDNFQSKAEPMAGCSIQLNYATASEAKTIFDQLAEEGEITMPWEPTFWSAGFGALVDRFGIRWMVGCDEQPG